jgi:hypothetical protein
MPDNTQQTTAATRYWFPAKSYGWGWGFPVTWEGWLTFAIFIAVCCSSGWLSGGSIGATVAIIFAAACMLVGVAWCKGEPPRWRWGNRD